jgi:hypothetical protein
MNASPGISDAGTYTPGYASRKLLVALFGLILFGLGAAQLSTPLRLLAFGRRTTAEATCVVKSKQGLPDLILINDLQVQANLEPRDRSYIFWNQFRFQTDSGSVVNVRAAIGSQLKPLYPLLDADGLPTTDVIYYNPSHPDTVVFPNLMGTWFVPGFLVAIGVLCTIIGSVLFYWADKPIELPHLPPTNNASLRGNES